VPIVAKDEQNDSIERRRIAAESGGGTKPVPGSGLTVCGDEAREGLHAVARTLSTPAVAIRACIGHPYIPQFASATTRYRFLSEHTTKGPTRAELLRSRAGLDRPRPCLPAFPLHPTHSARLLPDDERRRRVCDLPVGGHAGRRRELQRDLFPGLSDPRGAWARYRFLHVVRPRPGQK
jgi:hypothetical protein